MRRLYLCVNVIGGRTFKLSSCRSSKGVGHPWGSETCLKLLIQAMILQLCLCLSTVPGQLSLSWTPKQQQMKVSVPTGNPGGFQQLMANYAKEAMEFSFFLPRKDGDPSPSLPN